MLYRTLFKLHGWLGISVGLVLGLIGLTGATMAFEDEIMTALSPGVVTVARSDAPLLAPDALIAAALRQRPGARVTQLVMQRDPTRAPKIIFAPAGKKSGSASSYLDPHDGRLLGPATGEAFFDTVENLHRWLALPGHANGIGRSLTGITALCLIFFALSGLYLRWPRRPLAWREWLVLDLRRGGATLYRNLHRVIGGWLFLLYLFSAFTGLWWSFDWYQQGVRYALTGTTEKGAKKEPAAKDAPLPSLALPWATVMASDGASYERIAILMPTGKGPIRMRVLPLHARFDRMTDELNFNAKTGALTKSDRYADRPTGSAITTSFHAFHTGAFFGLPGRIALFVSSVSMPMFTVTGLLLYFGRRLKKRRNRQKRLDAAAQLVPTR
ncbi:PepSY-associated TM helix domain-containing protein [Sphingomonas nostoxanthinifaciens]|uniref:PepSY-associated TM helix domain-containing protein n=1 Tax=Sphingomonas nostoxanthinifaciens TaxID=2872652 RepID=UPI001CC1F9DD|nr:PepSY-associated TM helix domain-containing protein [Sphingomonas nostoxanthinifaciens]UAK22855.1 PepSY domain-containing protein [Sphingomonas nostoxanthinifaciens]